MALYSIKEETLTDIGDALRRHHGETKQEAIIEECAVYKTEGAVGFGDVNPFSLPTSGYQLRVSHGTSGAAYLVVKASYYQDDGVWFSINGERMPVNKDESLIIERTINKSAIDIVHYRSDATVGKEIYGGAYVEVYAYDADGNLIPYSVTSIEVPNTYKSSEMAAAIDAIEVGDVLPEEAFLITGDCQYKFNGGSWDWFIEKYGNRITTKDINNAIRMFANSKIEELPFEINFSTNGCACNNMFFDCKKLDALPSIDFQQASYQNCTYLLSGCNTLVDIGAIKNLYPADLSYFFYQCYNMKFLPEFINLNLSRVTNYTYSNCSNMFGYCYSLRDIPEDFLKQLYGIWTSAHYTHISSIFSHCASLDEIVGLNPQTGTITASIFGTNSTGSFAYCNRIKNLIFATQDDGTPYAVKWKTQTIDLSTYIGYVSNPPDVLNYNSGITEDKKVTDDASYQALKDDPDWWTTDVNYSRYNHDSAVATINSLPDTSAYLATAGGTNTIKFKGDAGSATDGGAINTLTEEEIAVATAKGWTITFG